MRILQVNKFYYRRGGDCIVALRTEEMLRQHGHEVAVFAMSYPKNLSSPWSGYFASEVDFDTDRIRAMRRAMVMATSSVRFGAFSTISSPMSCICTISTATSRPLWLG